MDETTSTTETSTTGTSTGAQAGDRSRRRLTIGLGVGALVLAAAAVTTTQLVGDDGDADAASESTDQTTSQTDTSAGGPAQACAAELFFEGQTYTQADAGDLVEGPGDAIGTATVPPCDDTPGQEQADDAIQTVEVFAVDAGPGGGTDADIIYADGATWTLAP